MMTAKPSSGGKQSAEKKRKTTAEANAAKGKTSTHTTTTTNNNKRLKSTDGTKGRIVVLNGFGQEINEVEPKRDARGNLVFKDFPKFRPSLSPKQVIHAGHSWRIVIFISSVLDMVLCSSMRTVYGAVVF